MKNLFEEKLINQDSLNKRLTFQNVVPDFEMIDESVGEEIPANEIRVTNIQIRENKFKSQPLDHLLYLNPFYREKFSNNAKKKIAARSFYEKSILSKSNKSENDSKVLYNQKHCRIRSTIYFRKIMKNNDEIPEEKNSSFALCYNFNANSNSKKSKVCNMRKE